MSRASNLAGFVTSISPVNNLTVGVITATSFIGDGSGLTGIAITASYVSSSGISSYSSLAGVSTYSTTAGVSTVSQGLTGTPNISVGIATASNIVSTSSTVGISTVNTILDVIGSYRSSITSVAAFDVNCSSGNYFTKTVTGISTFTFSNVPSSRVYTFALEVTHTSGSISFPASVKWSNDTTPSLTSGKTHIFIFITDDGGTRWRGSSLVNYTN